MGSFFTNRAIKSVASFGALALMTGVISACAGTQSADVPASVEAKRGPVNIGLISAQDAPAGAESEAEASAESATAEVLSSVRFFRSLNEMPNASLGHTIRLAYMLDCTAQGNEEAARARLSDAEYANKLIETGLIGANYGGDLSRDVTFQEAAWLFARAVQLEGGVLWSLVGNERYAHREMVARGIFSSENARQLMSGGELLGAYREARNLISAGE